MILTMYSTSILILSLLLSLNAAYGSEKRSTDVTQIEPYDVPVFTIQELQNGSRRNELEHILTSTGLLSVVGSDQDMKAFKMARQNAFEGLCACMKNGSTEFSAVDGVDSLLLSDQTTRTTLATATVGNTPLPLRSEVLENAGCKVETIQAMDYIRDYVAWGSKSFVTALDDLLGNTSPILLETSFGGKFTSVSSIIKASQNLEHFHVYSKSNDATDTFDLDLHTDAGLFLSFVPGMECDAKEHVIKSDDFYIEIKNKIHRAVFSENSFGIMLGVGAEHWLKSSVKLLATRHAVSIQSGHNRVWYGIMYLVPQDAIIQDFPIRTFADMRKSMVLSSRKSHTYSKLKGDDVEVHDVAVGCGTTTSSWTSSRTRFGGETRINRRRLGMVDNASACNNVTNFFCWMSCLSIPDYEDVPKKLDDGLSLYCLDPEKLATTGNLSVAVSQCGSNSHNDICAGSWQPTKPGVPYQEMKTDEESVNNASLQFCYGGTSMFMDGFHWTNATCVIYLFPGWILSSASRLVVACIGTLFFGVLLEYVISKRRSVVQSFTNGWKRIGMSTLFYGLQLTLGYFLMLVVMTYSGPLFMCVIFGLMGGHAMFNAKGLSSKVEDSERGTHCLNGEVQETIQQDISNILSQSEFDDAPEGFTPCCQNQL